MVLEDIISSTALQEQPKLYEYHQGLLYDNDGIEPPINLESVIYRLPELGIAMFIVLVKLQLWRHGNSTAGEPKVMSLDLVHRVTAIKHA